jgi:hypothetical protein
MPVNRERMLIRKEVEDFNVEYMTLPQVEEYVRELKNRHGPEATVEMLENYNSTYYWAVMKEFPETDEQMSERIGREERFEAIRMERDREEFERLKKLFENSLV